MTRNEILKKARTTEANKAQIFQNVLTVLQDDAFTSKPSDWEYNTVTKEYSKCYELWNVPKIKYSRIEKYEDDVRLVVAYDFHSELMYGRVYIPEESTCKLDSVQRILPTLKGIRKSLHTKWEANAKNVIANYFEVHKEEFVKYPLAFTGGFRTKRFVLWNCRSQYDKEMREQLGVLTNQVREILNEKEFFPSFWESLNQTVVDVHLGDYIMHVYRSYAPDMSYMHDWPDVYVHFEIVSSDNSEWQNALDVVRYHKESEKYRKYKDFKESMEQVDWQFRIVDGVREAYAYVPIIFSEYAEFIRKEAIHEFGKEMLINICTQYIPFYEADMTCLQLIVVCG